MATAASQLVEECPGAGEPCRFKEREAADRLGGIELTAHQPRQALAWALQLRGDHGDHILQPLAEQRIRQAGAGLCQIDDALLLRHGRAAQTAQLGQHEPDPVALLVARPQFLECQVIGAACSVALGRVEAFQRIRGCGRSAGLWWSWPAKPITTCGGIGMSCFAVASRKATRMVISRM